MNAEIITIGDEILLGQIVDTNSAWIAQYLGQADIAIRFITSISDRREDISKALLEASSRSDFVIVTGGLGPTKDDVTKETISQFFESPFVRNQQVLDHVKQIFLRIGRGEMPISNYTQADVLECAQVLFNDVGTAPGMWVERDSRCFVFLPGVPFEMKFLMEKHIMPRLMAMRSQVRVYHSHILTAGLGESFLAEQIADIEASLPHYIKLAYLPKIGLVRLRLSATGTDANLLRTDTENFAERISERLKEYVVAKEDISFEEAIIKNFGEANLKIAFAESCTGGTISSNLTKYKGASKVFDCGIVAYANHIKQEVLGVNKNTLDEFGAVSEQTVVEMAKGVQRISGAEYAVATSGIAGPSGGTLEKPVGTVWIAVAGKNETVTKKFQFNNNRQINIERSAMQALLLLWNLYVKESI
ncbi:competence/damage-inducible protein A [Sphingobacterium pedocola]|uniref:CinA-like protein n=1 Tax=Sphingobacterium pedocola TaxID=2082722 RepID=A0ABR9TCZ6_9SPHI|nr:competence/damage-inducible protein A [Sphingobacterium pedocola]MBE8723230.1 competence/damage-inducible protein A [Sphingobacterium pedocola]